jgi:hypothetical protein
MGKNNPYSLRRFITGGCYEREASCQANDRKDEQ